MKLIDADLLIESIQATLNTGKETFPADLFRGAVDEQPTAFDVDKVVSLLEEEKSKNKFDVSILPGLIMSSAINSTLDKAIEIVKGGGIE